ncbi:DUF4339 domain-containing protein [Rhizobium oryzihabitans]|uniref:DUF4339 domain-containing protein n=1 Tax=Rhizobium oryzihabitans TaxID=2267833 RepID=A0A7L5BGU0_9HYPH|nr:DUF4339 domain-containing protein [Rhizobium oryzihabitans]
MWHYNSNGKRNGPVDGATIIDLHKRGEISDDTLLWNQQLGNQWARFDTITEFKSSNGSEPPRSLHLLSVTNGHFCWR